MWTLLRNRSLVIVGLAESVSSLGNWITTLAVYALVIFRGQGGAAQSSAILLAGLLPALVFSPVAGWLCDRFDRKRLMMASELLSGLAVAGLIFARRSVLIYSLLATQSAFGAVLMPTRQAVVPQLVGRDELIRANALLQQLAGIIKIGGPFLGGLLLALVEPQQAMIVDVASFLLSALILSQLPALPPARAPAAQEAGGQTGPRLAFFDVLRQVPLLALLLVLAFLVTALIMSFDVLASVYTRDVLQSNESLFGTLIGLIGLGTVAATAGLMMQKRRSDPLRDLVVAVFLLSCIPTSLALGAQTDAPAARWLAAGGCLLGGLGNGLVAVQVSTLLQILSPPDWLGRIGGALQSTFIAGQLIAVLATPLLVPGLLPVGAFFGLAGLGMALLGLASGVLWRRRAGVAGELS